MSRLKNFSRNLAASYLQLGVNVVYSLVSIPLILHWLPKAEFGLWALLVQMLGYLGLIDLGMTAAVGRLLVDHKDQRDAETYGSLVKTSGMVSLVQGGIILAIITLGSPLLATLMKIPAEYQQTFIALMRIQGVIVAFSFCLRPLGLMLYAHQRMDIPAYSEIFNLLASLGLLVFFLMEGCGIYSFVYASAFTVLVGPVFLFWNCRRLGFLPRKGEWGQVSWRIFNEVFSFGKDVFLFNLGQQLTTASQIIIVSRMLGLEAAAAWAVGTKVFNLFIPLMCRPYGAALPGLYEMHARGETDRLKSRFKGVVLLTASLGAFLGISFALCNSLFVNVWTGDKIVWLPWNDVLLGLWLFITSLQTTHINIVNVTKQYGGARYIYFLEGCCFVVLSIFLGCRWQASGIIATSAICTLCFSYQYGIRVSCRYFHCRLKELAFDWVRPSLKLALVFGVFAVATWLATTGLSVVWRLAVHAFMAGTVGGLLFLRLGFPAEMIREAVARLPHPAARLLKVLSPCEP
jgi:O-antigen/teichoic acid export membrane protein